MLSDKSVQEITAQYLIHRLKPHWTSATDTRSSVTMDAIKSYILRHGACTLRPPAHRVANCAPT